MNPCTALDQIMLWVLASSVDSLASNVLAPELIYMVLGRQFATPLPSKKAGN